MSETLDLAAMRAKAAAQVKAADEQTSAEPEKENTELVPREIPINVVYPEPGTGKTLHYNLVSRIMTGEERRVAGRMEVALAGGVGVASMSTPAQNRIRALAVCSVQLRDPDTQFVTYLEEDDVLLMNIYGALEDHDRRYYFRDGGSGETAASPRGLAIVTPFGGATEG
jgi:hypothetical protein